MGKIAEMMGGLPMEDLISAPLVSVVSAQRGLAEVMIDYVDKVGYVDPAKSAQARMLRFELDKPVISEDAVSTTKVTMQAPMLGLLPMPALLVDHVTIDFQMEVSSTESSKENLNAEASLSVTGGCRWVKATVSGKVSTSKENTRSTNQSAKYQVHVEANQQPQTECLAKLMDMFAACTEPVKLEKSASQDQSAA
ncbi:MAG: DUF2589 domain-containing protein [Candidatus Treponema excrementipullorum]|uniref:DUF2589 domain-containing protein n=1 Tax=Candidatus Treponema excrementipullorum TaxID=2838768 RepID=A0A9E2L1I8_9SPIR|nr:DUF2589 domain-containing protein [Candidatus Treponema excrementipullorum]